MLGRRAGYDGGIRRRDELALALCRAGGLHYQDEDQVLPANPPDSATPDSARRTASPSAPGPQYPDTASPAACAPCGAPAAPAATQIQNSPRTIRRAPPPAQSPPAP